MLVKIWQLNKLQVGWLICLGSFSRLCHPLHWPQLGHCFSLNSSLLCSPSSHSNSSNKEWGLMMLWSLGYCLVRVQIHYTWFFFHRRWSSIHLLLHEVSSNLMWLSDWLCKSSFSHWSKSLFVECVYYKCQFMVQFWVWRKVDLASYDGFFRVSLSVVNMLHELLGSQFL